MKKYIFSLFACFLIAVPPQKTNAISFNLSDYTANENFWKYSAIGNFTLFCAYFCWTQWLYHHPKKTKRKKHKKKIKNVHGSTQKKRKKKKHATKADLDSCKQYVIEQTFKLRKDIFDDLNANNQRFANSMMPLQLGHQLLTNTFASHQYTLRDHSDRLMVLELSLPPGQIPSRPSSPPLPPVSSAIPLSPRGTGNGAFKLRRTPSSSSLPVAPSLTISQERAKKDKDKEKETKEEEKHTESTDHSGSD